MRCGALRRRASPHSAASGVNEPVYKVRPRRIRHSTIHGAMRRRSHRIWRRYGAARRRMAPDDVAGSVRVSETLYMYFLRKSESGFCVQQSEVAGCVVDDDGTCLPQCMPGR